MRATATLGNLPVTYRTMRQAEFNEFGYGDSTGFIAIADKAYTAPALGSRLDLDGIPVIVRAVDYSAPSKLMRIACIADKGA